LLFFDELPFALVAATPSVDKSILSSVFLEMPASRTPVPELKFGNQLALNHNLVSSHLCEQTQAYTEDDDDITSSAKEWRKTNTCTRRNTKRIETRNLKAFNFE